MVLNTVTTEVLPNGNFLCLFYIYKLLLCEEQATPFLPLIYLDNYLFIQDDFWVFILFCGL